MCTTVWVTSDVHYSVGHKWCALQCGSQVRVPPEYGLCTTVWFTSAGPTGIWTVLYSVVHKCVSHRNMDCELQCGSQVRVPPEYGLCTTVWFTSADPTGICTRNGLACFLEDYFEICGGTTGEGFHVHDLKEYRDSGGTTPLILNLSTRRR